MTKKNLIIVTHAFAPEQDRHLESVTEAGITARPCDYPSHPGLWNAFKEDSTIVIQDSTFHSEEAMRVMFGLVAHSTLPKNCVVKYDGVYHSNCEITNVFNKQLNRNRPIVSIDVDIQPVPESWYALAFQNVLKFLHLSK